MLRLTLFPFESLTENPSAVTAEIVPQPAGALEAAPTPYPQPVDAHPPLAPPVTLGKPNLEVQICENGSTR